MRGAGRGGRAGARWVWLCAAFGRGAMPNIEELVLGANPISSQGLAALAAPVRKMPMLKTLALPTCGVGDEGVASLVDDLGKDDFKKLETVVTTASPTLAWPKLSLPSRRVGCPR